MSKTVLITGTSTGIGLASAKLFATRGWNVVATLRHPESDNELAVLPNTLVTRLDVADLTSIEAAVALVSSRFGHIDVLINNAGYGQNGLFEATPRGKAQAQFDVNLFGVMDVIRAVLPTMRARKSGVIVNVSSGAGIFTLPGISLYCASKFALEGFSESLSYELASQNIAVKLVIPHGGVTETRYGSRTVEAGVENLHIADYDDFEKKTAVAFGRMAATRSISSADVAARIFEAATDGSNTLRYLIGDDSRGFVKARRELPEADYIAFMRAHFA